MSEDKVSISQNYFIPWMLLAFLCLFPHSVRGTTRSSSDGVMLVSKNNSRELGIRGDEYDEYKKMLQKKFFEMGQEYGCLLPLSITFSFRNGKDVCSLINMFQFPAVTAGNWGFVNLWGAFSSTVSVRLIHIDALADSAITLSDSLNQKCHHFHFPDGLNLNLV